MKALLSIVTAATLSSAPALAGGCGGCSSGYNTADKDDRSNAVVINASYDHHNHGSSMSDGNTIAEIASGDDRFSTLVAALKAANLVSALNGDTEYTVFAPTNEAFSKLPAGTVETLLKPENRDQLRSILTFHVVKGEAKAADVVTMNTATTLQGQRVDINVNRRPNGDLAGVRVNGANVVRTDIDASNGVIHVIDSVILPEMNNAVETARAAGNFRTLLAAAQAAGIVDALTGDGPITILAPTDDAFAKLPSGTVESLLREENHGKLREILTYHVIEGRVYDDGAIKAGKATTLQGGKVSFDIVDGRLMANDAKVIASDIEASNAVIHAIDTVLMPR